jgi:hypothetical protein
MGVFDREYSDFLAVAATHTSLEYLRDFVARWKVFLFPETRGPLLRISPDSRLNLALLPLSNKAVMMQLGKPYLPPR